jgi:hypothetical protein
MVLPFQYSFSDNYMYTHLLWFIDKNNNLYFTIKQQELLNILNNWSFVVDGYPLYKILRYL